ncbi:MULTISPECIES: bis(5'-nucleosyl)-tetraphosphatase (symmetrical) YqeK [unclassified Ruminococcus]|uniref:bis(5'-nucleosyl)-tetraphosphatase (symmetrical) YqeK n=1 Tax=unclassified Ruminococcus TaxID=2608920 RepID=UPI00210D42EA|nr:MULTISPECIES: bis(5'-nucleosyl)-tetraphosphatase (symmetrical) YqeK [unclassified Ruminococcus]MCQ4021639.1 HD domain-containing protein [Ruminococcus sp. zg-924]MCQ4114084.1 HD domain-containing protein [Ruminococcus sp. zg-921]
MTFKEYRKIVKSRMGEKRFSHSENVSKEAIKLAKLYGADPEKAELAGILHDITKETPHEEQLQIMEKNGIILSKLQLSSPKLWHSLSGAAYIESELGITDQDIINAVRYHTSGRAGMSILEKIIFVADFTSEERDYDDVDVMRKKSRKSLEEAMHYGLSFTLSDLIKRERIIDPNAIDCYNDITINYTF